MVSNPVPCVIHRIRYEKYIIVNLPLGADQSGKSAFKKQVQLLDMIDFTLEERKSRRQVIFDNIMVAFVISFEARREWKFKYESDDSLVSIESCELLII